MGTLSSRPKGDPGLHVLPIFQDFVLLSNHTPEYSLISLLFLFIYVQQILGGMILWTIPKKWVYISPPFPGFTPVVYSSDHKFE